MGVYQVGFPKALFFESFKDMWRLFSDIIFFFVVLSWEWRFINTTELSADRAGKHFSLFSVVTFKNEECTSESTLTGGARQGTCYTTTECSDKSGQKSGNCASGFGVCCVFLNTAAATATVSENRTYLRNSEYPAYTTATAATTIAYTIDKMNADICQIRLDFTNFVIAGPALSNENLAGTTTLTGRTNDYATIVATSSTNLWPTICGNLYGEHLYVELGTTAADNVVFTIVTSTAPTPAIAQRYWDVKTSHIPCYANYRAPSGCQRYFTTDYGKIISLNFHKTTGDSYTAASTSGNSALELANQNLNTCIRRSKGMCCVEYQTCITYSTETMEMEGSPDDEGDTGINGQYHEAWTIDTETLPYITPILDNSGLVDAQCSGDYVGIPSSWSGPCNGGTGSAQLTVNSRYCGAHFGANWGYGSADGAAANEFQKDSPVCDCSEPFMVTHRSDMMNDKADPADSTAAANPNIANVVGRGFCLDFTQQSCWR